MSLNNTAAAPGAPIGPRPTGPSLGASQAAVWDVVNPFLEAPQGDLFRDAEWSQLLERAIGTPRSPILEALVDLRFRYTVSHRLPGSLHFEDHLPEIHAPEAPLKSVLEHLVEGALRSNPSSAPYCHVGVVEESEERVVLAIRDNGVHLPECSLEDLRRFVQSNKVQHVPDRVYRLFLADALVQWLGGKIRIAPSPNQNGTTIHLELPRKTDAQPKDHPLVGRHVF